MERLSTRLRTWFPNAPLPTSMAASEGRRGYYQ